MSDLFEPSATDLTPHPVTKQMKSPESGRTSVTFDRLRMESLKSAELCNASGDS